MKSAIYHIPKKLLLGLLLLNFNPIGIASDSVIVSNVSELIMAVNNANQGVGPSTILVSNGTYTLNQMLWIDASGVTIQSVSGNRNDVVLEGLGMHGSVTHIFNVAGSQFTVKNMTLRNVSNHAIQLQINVDDVVIENLHILDTYEQMVKVVYDPSDLSLTSDNGIVRNCLLEYSAGMGPQYYIGGIDAHNAKNWTIQNNTFKNIRSPSQSLAEHAIHFWSSSKKTLVEGNTIINCDRGIGFGLGDRGHRGGIIRNNMIYHDSSEGFADVGISLESAKNAKVYNNTIIMEHRYPYAIEYRFSETQNAFIVNNLTNKLIVSRDGGEAQLSHNIMNAEKNWFINYSSGDLHLNDEIERVVDQGLEISKLTHDYDKDIRPFGNGYDIGSDEYTGTELSIVKVKLKKTSPFRLKIKGTQIHPDAELYLNGVKQSNQKYEIKNYRKLVLKGGKKTFKENDWTRIKIVNPDQLSAEFLFNLKSQLWTIEEN